MKSTHITDLIHILDTPQSPTKPLSCNMDRLRYIEKPLKVSKKSFPRGLKLEVESSRIFHLNSLPVLVSPSFLRSRYLGQIDLAKLTKDNNGWLLEVSEVKSSIVGAEASLSGQKTRLISACSFLGRLLGVRVKLTCIVR